MYISKYGMFVCLYICMYECMGVCMYVCYVVCYVYIDGCLVCMISIYKCMNAVCTQYSKSVVFFYVNGT